MPSATQASEDRNRGDSVMTLETFWIGGTSVVMLSRTDSALESKKLLACVDNGETNDSVVTRSAHLGEADVG